VDVKVVSGLLKFWLKCYDLAHIITVKILDKKDYKYGCHKVYMERAVKKNDTLKPVIDMLPQVDKTPKESTVLSRRVICPICKKEGLLTARQRKKQWYLYVRHSVKENNKWRVKEHYVGPARLFYISRSLIGEEEWLFRELLVNVEAKIGKSCYVTYTLTEKVKEELKKLQEESKDKKKAMQLISLMRQIMIDYYAELLWLKELIDLEIKKVEKQYGIGKDEAERVLKTIKENYITVIFYRKI
jgi:hypothetical protein